MKPTDEEIISALKKVASIYGKNFACTIECLFRNETAHFKSGGFLNTLSPGMQATTTEFPYGWSSLAQFWKDHSEYAPTGLHLQNENNSSMAAARKQPQTFIIMPSIEGSMMSVSRVISSRGGNGGAWFSITDKAAQDKYNAVLKTIIPRFVNANVL